ncbi:hypothetical protein BKQ19_11555 [Lacticaseibacillus paracasei]|nr:hypothetical protein BKQ19_11555 [Lacticaseibacillus paracasei]
MVNDALASHPLRGKAFKDCVLNVYVYKAALVGVVEHKQYRRICDMNSFGFTAQDYIAWRHQQQEHPAALIGRDGRALNYGELRRLLYHTAEDSGWPVFTSPVEDLFFD